MKPFALFLLTCAITFSVHAFDPAPSGSLLDLETNAARQLAEIERSRLIEELVRVDSSNSTLCGLHRDYDYIINQLLSERNRQRDCIGTCDVWLAKHKCTYRSVGTCTMWLLATAALAGTGMLTTSVGMCCCDNSDCSCDHNPCTGTCCKLAYIGAPIGITSCFTGLCIMNTCFPTPNTGYSCVQICDRNRFHRLSDTQLEETPLVSQARNRLRNALRANDALRDAINTMREDV